MFSTRRTREAAPYQNGRTPTADSRVRPLVALLTAALFLSLPLLNCSKEPSAPPTDQGTPSPEVSELPIGGGDVPQQITEGDAATLAVWGPVPGQSWMLDRVDLEVVSDPDEGPGRIEVAAMGRPMSSPGSMSAYSATVELPPLIPGQYLVVMHGPGGDRSFSLEVLPGSGWVHFRAHPTATEAARWLMVSREGWAVAFRGNGPRVRVPLSTDSLGVIRSWFDEAGFQQLQDRYLSDPPQRDQIDVIALREGDVSKRVTAEVPLMPPPLGLLASRLERLTMRILSQTPPPPQAPGIDAALAIEPQEADPGTARVIRLSLTNRRDSDVTLTFRTSQTYDFSLLSSPMVQADSGRVEPGSVGPLPPDSIPGPPMMLVWNWAHGRSFPDVITHITIGPRQTRTFEEAWEGRSNEGDVVGSGIYELVAVVPADVPVNVPPVRVAVRGTGPSGPPLAALVRCEPVDGAAGTPRTLTLSVTNLWNQPVTVTFPTTQRFDFLISDPRMMRPAPLWRWSEGREFQPRSEDVTWNPGETKTFSDTWDGTFPNGVTGAPGVYILGGFLTGRPAVQAHPAAFLIRGR